ncbi:hypothetical protein BJ742DRAFT_781214 [Cladochytrium replicatum]|nr:hypothetical protein BJ742DRAFT_781214 [Cladochytrium replicatum]
MGCGQQPASGDRERRAGRHIGRAVLWSREFSKRTALDFCKPFRDCLLTYNYPSSAILTAAAAESISLFNALSGGENTLLSHLQVVFAKVATHNRTRRLRRGHREHERCVDNDGNTVDVDHHDSGERRECKD